MLFAAAYVSAFEQMKEQIENHNAALLRDFVETSQWDQLSLDTAI